MSHRVAVTNPALAPRLSRKKVGRQAQSFSWEAVRSEFDGLPGGRGFNIAHEAIDRHARTSGDTVALRWLGPEGRSASVTYRELQLQSSCFANVLATLGLRQGATVFTLMPRLPPAGRRGHGHAQAPERLLSAL